VLKRFGVLMLLFGLLAGCDQKKIEELEEGVATEADVRAKFGEPAAVYNEENGSRTFEYPRQPEGQRNYMITVGADGKMSALRQVLKTDTFAKVTPGLDKTQVRRLLGRPGKTQVFQLKKEEVWDWRFLDRQENKVFTVTFDNNGIVTTSATIIDPRELNVGGGSK
jgi:SmpA / OmlA family